jgi:hypothetical protein
MATKADETRSRMQVDNSRQKRVTVGVKPVSASQRLKRNETARTTHRALHARTKSEADAKAGKPGDGKKVQRWRTGPNGGEDQTINGVAGTGRGADGMPGTKPSRKSTRGSWPAGEKRVALLTSRVTLEVTRPQERAYRKK